MSTYSGCCSADRHQHIAAYRPRRASGTRLVLTRRGRIVVLVLAMAVLTAIALTFGSATSATDAGGEHAPVTSVTIEPGQTLWDIAAEANPHGDLRHTVDRIMKLNSLPDAAGLQMGDVIAVPEYR